MYNKWRLGYYAKTEHSCSLIVKDNKSCRKGILKGNQRHMVSFYTVIFMIKINPNFLVKKKNPLKQSIN